MWVREWGIDISTGQVNRLLNEEHQMFEQEQHQVLKAGIEIATYIPEVLNDRNNWYKMTPIQIKWR